MAIDGLTGRELAKAVRDDAQPTRMNFQSSWPSVPGPLRRTVEKLSKQRRRKEKNQ